MHSFARISRPFVVLLLAVLSLLLVQCGDDSSSGSPKLNTTIETRDQFGNPVDTFSSGEEVTLVLIVENLKDRSVSVDVTAQQHEFVVTDQAGESVIWQWSLGMGFPAVMDTIVFAPGEIREFEVTWDQRDNDGFLVMAGEYRVQGYLTTFGENQRGLINGKSWARSCLKALYLN